ncbi:serine kinase [Erythrobacter insulae]|uniref:Serine kinase n=2 Tax=Erythrobacter insulae TaxID=2584124 RepID=A0A547PES4_9SPHN|nr:serine kinase [Erythrobacter insulae]
MQASAVVISGRTMVIEGAPGSGKSSLALALIDRGAGLIGDDGVTLERLGDRLVASPPANITGLIELRGVGLVTLPVAKAAPVAIILSLDTPSERLPLSVPAREIMGISIPVLGFEPGNIAPAVRAEWALAKHGLVFD